MKKWDSIAQYRESVMFERREKGVPHTSYASEKQAYRIIREGRTDLLKGGLSAQAEGTPGVLSKDRLRNEKNMVIVGVASYTRAAMDGGLPEELAYAMSDSYIMHAEDCRTRGELEEIARRAFREFTEAVAREKGKRRGRHTEAAIRYVRLHLHEKITLTGAAQAASVSCAHLSRVFQAETGLSFTEFVRRERVEEAKQLLDYTQESLSAISQYLQFSTQSYFVKVFKKVTGMTPGAYRNRLT